MSTETDPRVEIVAGALFRMRYGTPWPDDAANPAAWRADARAILAALDAARPVEPPMDEGSVAGLIVLDLRDAVADVHADIAADIQEGRYDAEDAEDPRDVYISIPQDKVLHAAATIERQQAEIALLKGDFNDVNAERERWKAEFAMARTSGDEARKALRKAEAEIARLTAERDEWKRYADAGLSEWPRAEKAEAEVADLHAKLAKAVEALGYYADKETYEPNPHGLTFDRRDKGQIARTTLASIKEHQP